MLKNLYIVFISLFIIFNNTFNTYCNEAIDDFDYYFHITDELLGKDYKYYTAIGDSISVGYGLDMNNNNEGSKKYKVDSFVNLLGASLKSKEVANLSSSDTDIEDLLLALRQLKQQKYIIQVFEEYIKQAKVITITLGEDIILNSIDEAISNKISKSSNKISTQEALFSILTDKLQSDKLILEIDKKVKKFIGSQDKDYEDGQFMQIIKLIRDMNSYCDVVVQTLYNPYKDTSISTELNKFVEDINFMIEKKQSNKTYKIVDTYSIFENTQNKVLLEDYPYPNKLGHKLIYENHLKVLDIKK